MSGHEAREEARCSRRGVLTATASLAMAAIVPARAGAQAAPKPIPTDAVLIAGLIQVEVVVADVYARAIASGALSPGGLALAREVLGHERAHAAALQRELRALRGAELPLPATQTALQAALATHHMQVNFSHSRTPRRWLKLLASVEQVLERNYHLAISELRRPALITLCAEILGSEAQHSALLGELLSPRNVAKAVPNAFVNGD